VRGLAGELISGAHDTAQLRRAWGALDPGERAMPELAIQAGQRLLTLGGESAEARAWLLPVDHLRVRLVRALEAGLEPGERETDPPMDREWLARIEAAQLRNPRDANLQYLAGMACMKRQLWGKAQQLLTHAALGLQDAGLHRRAWSALAELAEQREDLAAAAEAWKKAAQA
jgi:HemY protein